MNEFTLAMISLCKMVCLILFAFLYQAGGSSAFGGGKGVRRWAGSAWLTGSIMLISLWQGNFSWWYWWYALLLGIALCVGYGYKSTLMGWFNNKIIVRGIYGGACATAALPMVIVNGTWSFWSYYLAMVTITCISLGVWNIARNPREEESIIGLVIGFSVFLI